MSGYCSLYIIIILIAGCILCKCKKIIDKIMIRSYATTLSGIQLKNLLITDMHICPNPLVDQSRGDVYGEIQSPVSRHKSNPLVRC